MDEFFNSKKYIILLVIVCLLFTIITAKVFDYMPKPVNNQEYDGYIPYGNLNNNSTFSDTQIEKSFSANLNNEEDESDEDSQEDEDEDDDTSVDDDMHRSGHIDFMPPSAYQNTNDFVEIPAPKGSNEDNIQAIDTN